jgi:hypothetical protein
LNDEQRLVFRVHAIQRMFERGIAKEDVRQALSTGKTIEAYPEDQPYPSRLVLGWIGTRPIHVVVAAIRFSRKQSLSPCMNRIRPGGRQGLREGGSGEMRDL